MKESTIERHGMILGEAAILGEQFVRWTAPLSGLLGMRVCEATPDLAMPPPGHVAVRFRRGFVADLVCYPAQWADRHCDILALCPLERVAFIDSVDREYHEMLPNSWRGGRASLVSTRWLPRGDLAVRLVSAPHEIMVPNAKLAMHGYGPCVNEAGLELCHRAWPGIQFLVARKEP